MRTSLIRRSQIRILPPLQGLSLNGTEPGATTKLRSQVLVWACVGTFAMPVALIVAALFVDRRP